MDALAIIILAILGAGILSICGAFGTLIIKRGITPTYKRLVLVSLCLGVTANVMSIIRSL